MNQNTSPLDVHKTKIESWLSKGYTTNQVVAKLQNLGIKTSQRSVQRALKRWGIGSFPQDRSYTKIDDNKAEFLTSPSNIISSPEELVLEHGLDPEVWEIGHMTLNKWDSPSGEALHQVKVSLTKKIDPDELDILPARVPSDYRKPDIKKSKKVIRGKKGSPELVVFAGDQQAPYQDPDLHEKFCQWLADFQPERGVLIGDTIDLPSISRHPSTPEIEPNVQECVDSGYQLLRDYVESSESTSWVKLEGNHDYRLRRAVIDNLKDFYGIRRGKGKDELPESPLLDVAHLLRLDELGIEFARPEGSWEQTQIEISPHLAARHGWVARKGSGASALATLEHLGYSVIVGHTHRQSLVYKTKHDINGKPSTITGVETGCMCRIEGGLGYAVAPDWLNGFATAWVWSDGKFKIDLATYVDGVLYYGDKRYE